MVIKSSPFPCVQIVAAFACHEIEGTFYLRADYSLECYTPAWDATVAYASCWLAFYVIAFPLLTMCQLHLHVQGAPPLFGFLDLRFLLHDYKPGSPTFCWEVVDLLRKLLLSIMGVFWSTKSTMCIGTALLISTFFMVLHAQYQPYRTASCNRLQMMCMTTLSVIYFCGKSRTSTHEGCI
jgi:hypothetical protein